MDILIFDIETIPQQTKLTEVQRGFLKEKVLRSSSFDIDNPPDISDEKYTEFVEECRKQMAVSPYLGEIVCIGTQRIKENGFGHAPEINDPVTFSGTEKTLVRDFWDYIDGEKFRFVSFNGLSFDVPWIINKTIKYGIRPTNQDFLVTKRFQSWPHFDVLKKLSDWDFRLSVSLEVACDAFGIETPKDGDIVAKTVEKAYKEGNISGIIEYCEKDLLATYKLYRKVNSCQPKN